MSFILDEHRTLHKAVVLERFSSEDLNGKRFQVSVLTKTRYLTEEAARAAFAEAKKRRKA